MTTSASPEGYPASGDDQREAAWLDHIGHVGTAASEEMMAHLKRYFLAGYDAALSPTSGEPALPTTNEDYFAAYNETVAWLEELGIGHAVAVNSLRWTISESRPALPAGDEELTAEVAGWIRDDVFEGRDKGESLYPVSERLAARIIAALPSRPSSPQATDQTGMTGLFALHGLDAQGNKQVADEKGKLIAAIKSGLDAQKDDGMYVRDDDSYVVVDGDLDVAALAEFVLAALESDGQEGQWEPKFTGSFMPPLPPIVKIDE